MKYIYIIIFLFIQIDTVKGFGLYQDSVPQNNDSIEYIIPDTITPIIQKHFKVPLTPKEFMTYQAKLDSVVINDSTKSIRIYANAEYSFRNFTQERVNSVYSDIRAKLPNDVNDYTIAIISNGKEISEYIPNYKNDAPIDSSRLWRNIDYYGVPWTKNLSRPFNIPRGLANRHIALWPSHGLYWFNDQEKWTWQRPPLFCTIEDMFTLSIVTPFLIPMLENSGAICYMPRERDWQTEEIIVDNDDPQSGFIEVNGSNYWLPSRQEGFYNAKEYYCDDSPFRRNTTSAADTLKVTSDTCSKTLDKKGTALVVETVSNGERESSCCWMPYVNKEGRYAVYVTYQSFPNSTTNAVYKIVHKGISTYVNVNQTMGGGTWVYLGTYDFGCGHSAENAVFLNNISSEPGRIISADAIRMGGGMGNIVRMDDGESDYRSQMPRFLEGARYYCQYAGLPPEIFNTKDGYNDYADDINSRSNALNWLAGGSIFHPDTIGCKVPIELSLGIHSDAGYSQNDDIYGTLVISTLHNDTLGEHFKNGIYRMASSDFADMMQHTICNDMTRYLHRTWYTREHLRKNYSETRKPEVPSAILEIVSHQNFTDMLLGHDPNVKFLLARSIYKSILKYISYQHGKQYVVQPLPVDNFAVTLLPGNKAKLIWTPREDPAEPNSRPTGYIVYTKCGDKDFDNGILTDNTCEYIIDIMPDSVYSFKVTAINDGGESFPSEELSVFKSSNETATILIVNGFTRLSAPAVINTPKTLGFSLALDYGVPYMKTPEYCGDQYNYNRNKKSSLGLSNTDMQGKFVIGNTFNYPSVHGQSVRKIGNISYSSASVNAVVNKHISINQYHLVDLILGLQKDDNKSSIYKYKSFPAALQKILTLYINKGGRLFVSGAYIGSDQKSRKDIEFTSRVLQYKYIGHTPDSISGINIKNTDIKAEFENKYNQEVYAIQHPEKILPVGNAKSEIYFSNGSVAGAISNNNKCYVMTIPFESIKGTQTRDAFMRHILKTLLK